jgi:hypothetical protein
MGVGRKSRQKMTPFQEAVNGNKTVTMFCNWRGARKPNQRKKLQYFLLDKVGGMK